MRAPLVGGYLWLFAAWLAFANRVPQSGEATPGSTAESIERLAEALGPFLAVSALSVVAYLVGSVVREVTAYFLYVLEDGRFLGEDARVWFPAPD